MKVLPTLRQFGSSREAGSKANFRLREQDVVGTGRLCYADRIEPVMVVRLRMIWSVLLFVATAYAVILVALFLMQRQMIFVPDRRDFSAELSPDTAFQIIETVTEDGVRLRHLWAPPDSAEAPVFVLLHGNGGHAGHRADKLTFLQEAGAGVLLAEYRGYGGNPGKPTETGLYADARSVMAWLAGQGIGPERVVLYGESLGSGVASKMAVESAEAGTPVQALILEAPFTSIAAIGQRRFWWLPAKWLTRDRFDNLGRIERVDTRLIVFHGTNDQIVPHDMGVTLAEAAKDPVVFLSVEGAGHLYLLDDDAVRREVLGLVVRQPAEELGTQ